MSFYVVLCVCASQVNRCKLVDIGACKWKLAETEIWSKEFNMAMSYRDTGKQGLLCSADCWTKLRIIFLISGDQERDMWAVLRRILIIFIFLISLRVRKGDLI